MFKKSFIAVAAATFAATSAYAQLPTATVADIDQDGSLNTATIFQDGVTNSVVSVDQIGINNLVNRYAVGGLQATQDGSVQNTLAIVQTGNSNLVTPFQDGGQGNFGFVTQTGNNNVVQLLQFEGLSNLATVTLSNSFFETVLVNQGGLVDSNNVATINFTDTDNAIRAGMAIINQQENIGTTATVTETDVSNSISLVQQNTQENSSATITRVNSSLDDAIITQLVSTDASATINQNNNLGAGSTSVTIFQYGVGPVSLGGNTASVNQSFSEGAAVNVAQADRTNGQSATVVQTNMTLAAINVIQDGIASSTAVVSQIGDAGLNDTVSVINLTQIGAGGHTALLDQIDASNSMIIATQSGSDAFLDAFQTGDYNELYSDQSGNSVDATVSQTGVGTSPLLKNIATLTQSANNVAAFVTQNGFGNTATINQF